MNSSESNEGTIRVDPRVVQTKRKVLGTTVILLVEKGFAHTSIEAIASASGVAKSTIYRHWTSRTELCVDAYRSVVQPEETPNSGNLRSDLVVLLARLADGLANSAWAHILPSLIDAAERDPRLALFHRELTTRRRTAIRTVLQLGQQRGDVSNDIDLDYVINLLSAPLFYRRFIQHQPNDRALVERIVDDVLKAVT